MDLAAAGGIESGAVENDRRARGFDHRANLGVKIVEKRIVVIEAVRHASFSIGIERTVIKWLRAVIPAAPGIERSMLSLVVFVSR